MTEAYQRAVKHLNGLESILSISGAMPSHELPYRKAIQFARDLNEEWRERVVNFKLNPRRLILTALHADGHEDFELTHLPRYQGHVLLLMVRHMQPDFVDFEVFINALSEMVNY